MKLHKVIHLFLLDGELNLEINVTKAIEGSGKISRAPYTTEEKLNCARSVIEIKNEDNGCAFYAITVAIKKIENSQIRDI